jgi:nucleoside-diphosphate-sugar epimerase
MHAGSEQENGVRGVNTPHTTSFIVEPDAPLLITGGSGFIGPAVVESALRLGFRNMRVMARVSSDVRRLEAAVGRHSGRARVEIIRGNLLAQDDCVSATRDAAVIFHLATGGGKSFPDAFMNSVLTTRNLLEASCRSTHLRRFVNVSSFAVYTNKAKPRHRILDEQAPVEEHAHLRSDAYCFAKVKQDAIVREYGARFGIPYVIVRPGSVFGPGKTEITGRVGISTFGLFLHLGGRNLLPLTYVDNCADAIVLAGITPGVEGETFNVVDDDLPSSRRFLRLYRRHVRRFPYLYVPHALSYGLCWLWEAYSAWSEEQLPAAFNRRRWHAEWKRTRYSNDKLKRRLGWVPSVSMMDGLDRYFEGCRGPQHA